MSYSGFWPDEGGTLMKSLCERIAEVQIDQLTVEEARARNGGINPHMALSREDVYGTREPPTAGPGCPSRTIPVISKTER